MVRLHAGRHAETVRIGLEQRLSLVHGDANHQRVLVLQAHEEAVMDVPAGTRLGSLALDLRQRLRKPTNLIEGHKRKRKPAPAPDYDHPHIKHERMAVAGGE